MTTNSASGYRIDERVIYLMVFLMIVSTAILAFRFRKAEPCSAVRIEVRATDYFEGSLISFHAQTQGGKSYRWDFNDGTGSSFGFPSIQHSFRNPGTYVVSVLVNDHCEGYETVVIKPAPVIARVSHRPEFIAPAMSMVDKPVTFEDTTSDATSWEWRFGESEIVDARTRKASWVYRTPGAKTIYLKVNGRQDRVSSTIIYIKDTDPVLAPYKPPAKRKPSIFIIPPAIQNIPNNPAPTVSGSTIPTGKDPIATAPAPVTEAAKPTKVADIQADEMILMIEGIVTGEKKMADFLPYFCEENIPVTYNGTPMNFNQMFNILKAIKKRKKIERPEVRLIKKSSTNCIKSMIVKVDKNRSFLGL
jgi:hypothetical protein